MCANARACVCGCVGVCLRDLRVLRGWWWMGKGLALRNCLGQACNARQTNIFREPTQPQIPSNGHMGMKQTANGNCKQELQTVTVADATLNFAKANDSHTYLQVTKWSGPPLAVQR